MKILAVSGGIDSVVMLHYLRNEPDIVVAHIDHGIRPSSGEDCAFVERLAGEYGLKFSCRHAELGPDCSEAKARQARYELLAEIASENGGGELYVAHHSDDVLESIAINLLRGTGWRGLAPMRSSGVVRPLLNWSKADIYRYATEHNLSFRLDQTNNEDTYLRNRVRQKLRDLPSETKRRLLELYARQCDIKDEIDAIINDELAELDSKRLPRDYFKAPESVEVLRELLARQDIHLTRPQLQQCLNAIRTFAPGKKMSLDRSHFLQISKYHFAIV